MSGTGSAVVSPQDWRRGELALKVGDTITIVTEDAVAICEVITIRERNEKVLDKTSTPVDPHLTVTRVIRR